MKRSGYWSTLEEIAVAEAMRWAMRLKLPIDLEDRLRPMVQRRQDGLLCDLCVQHRRLPFKPFPLVAVLVDRSGTIAKCEYAAAVSKPNLEIKIRRKTGWEKGKVYKSDGGLS